MLPLTIGNYTKQDRIFAEANSEWCPNDGDVSRGKIIYVDHSRRGVQLNHIRDGHLSAKFAAIVIILASQHTSPYGWIQAACQYEFNARGHRPAIALKTRVLPCKCLGGNPPGHSSKLAEGAPVLSSAHWRMGLTTFCPCGRAVLIIRKIGCF